MPPPAEKPKKKHRFLKVLGGAAALIILISIVNSITGGGDGPTKTTSSDQPAASSEEAADKPADAHPAKPADEPKPIGLNQEASDGDFTFKVTKIEDGGTKIGDEYLNTKAQGKFVLVHMTIKNHGTDPGTFFGDNQYLVDTQGRKASADTEAAIYMGDNAQAIFEEINPGNTLSGVVVFDIPANATPASLELHDSAMSGGVTVTVK